MAKVKILVEGCLSKDNEGRIRPTISLVLDGNVVMVVDPGFLDDEKILIDALNAEGFSVTDVNIVCITHSHIDHYANIGLFANARILEYYGIWEKEGNVKDWRERFTENIQILKTPGHNETCITLFVKTDDGIVSICGDVFWKENYPEIDPYATDFKKLGQSRMLVLKMSRWVIPGHGGIYKTENGKQAGNGLVKKVEGKVEGSCKKCRKPFLRFKDKCICQEWLCYKCCECESDCDVCNCKVKRRFDIGRRS